MMFEVRNFRVVGYAHGFTTWVYKPNHSIAGVLSDGGYFDAATDMMKPGDQINVVASDGAAILLVRPPDDGGFSIVHHTQWAPR